jgi:hypothetical protein
MRAKQIRLAAGRKRDRTYTVEEAVDVIFDEERNNDASVGRTQRARAPISTRSGDAELKRTRGHTTSQRSNVTLFAQRQLVSSSRLRCASVFTKLLALFFSLSPFLLPPR